MTVVVTGATGHIGANLVRTLLAHSRPTRALVHMHKQALDGLEIELVEGDIRDRESLVRAFDGAEVVYHLAARISILTSEWPQLEMSNVIGTRNVVEACLHCRVRRLVHFSSVHSMEQDPMNVPVDEARPLVNSRRCLAYDRSKAAGEREVRRGIEKGLEAVIICPTAVIGPHDYQISHFGEALLALARGRLPALVAGGFDWVDVRDVAEGAMLAEKGAPTGAKYILSGHWVSLCDLADQVSGITGVPAPRFVCPAWLAGIGAPFLTAFYHAVGRRSLYTRASIRALGSNRDISHEKATRELGYYPRPFWETLNDALRWFEETGRLTCQVAKTKG